MTVYPDAQSRPTLREKSTQKKPNSWEEYYFSLEFSKDQQNAKIADDFNFCPNESLLFPKKFLMELSIIITKWFYFDAVC